MVKIDRIEQALSNLDRVAADQDRADMIPLQQYLELLRSDPEQHLRNVFQQFHDMVKYYVGEGVDEYPDDPESIGFAQFDCSRLLAQGADSPYFADRLFANRFMGLVDNLKRGVQQNKIYIFDGPPGCGKSTFLNNLLLKYEEYANQKEGMCYEVVWRLDRDLLGDALFETLQMEKLSGAESAARSGRVKSASLSPISQAEVRGLLGTAAARQQGALLGCALPQP